jgi:uncharacterized protein (DUF1499 family)
MSKVLKWLAVLSALGFPLALIGFRIGLYGFGTGFQILNYTFYLALIVLIAGLVVFVLHRRAKPASGRNAVIAVAISLIPIVGLGSQVYLARTVPAIHNISTDVVNPPGFDALVIIRGEGANPLAYSIENGNLAELQQAAYPNIKTMNVSASVQDSFDKALGVAQSLGWEIVNINADMGIIEATQTTTLWQFKDDIVIRVQADSETPNTTNVDLRSVSRVGRSDLGANAKRIQGFKDQFNR